MLSIFEKAIFFIRLFLNYFFSNEVLSKISRAEMWKEVLPGNFIHFSSYLLSYFSTDKRDNQSRKNLISITISLVEERVTILLLSQKCLLAMPGYDASVSSCNLHTHIIALLHVRNLTDRQSDENNLFWRCGRIYKKTSAATES